MNPVVSIIIPVYMTESYLPKCIESVLAQTMTNIEIIAINDGSSDNSLNILNDFKKRDKRVKVIDIKNSGVSIARNIGIKNSSGKYIVFIDSDDWVEVNMIEKLFKACEDTKCSISKCDVFYEKLGITRKLNYSNNNVEVYSAERAMLELFTDSSEKHFGYATNKMYEKNLLDRINLKFKEEMSYAEDVVFFTQAILEAGHVAYVPAQLYHYLLVNESITRSYIKDMSKAQQRLYSCLYYEMNKRNVYKNLSFYFSYYMFLGLRNLFKNENKNLNLIKRYQVLYKLMKEFNHNLNYYKLELNSSMFKGRFRFISWLVKKQIYLPASIIMTLEDYILHFRNSK